MQLSPVKKSEHAHVYNVLKQESNEAHVQHSVCYSLGYGTTLPLQTMYALPHPLHVYTCVRACMYYKTELCNDRCLRVGCHLLLPLFSSVVQFS